MSVEEKMKNTEMLFFTRDTERQIKDGRLSILIRQRRFRPRD